MRGRSWWALMVGASAAASVGATELPLNEFHESAVREGRTDAYKVWLSATTPAVKVVLLPLSGDTDVLVSFDPNATSATSASAPTWSMTGSGVEELYIRREFFCMHDIAKGAGLGPTPAAAPESGSSSAPACHLYLRVRAFYETEDATYKVGVLHAQDPFSVGSECHPGCPLALLANDVCDPSCNVTACAFDRGACVPQLAAACSPGCDADWLNDGYCDDACFTAECDWDVTDCAEIDIEGCADSCFSEYIDDGECDKPCNVAECKWDGSDCAHGHSECYERPHGEDYRGAVNVTSSGKPCQRWSSQFPQQHFFTHARYPNDGLGAHAACRNPGGVNDGPCVGACAPAGYNASLAGSHDPCQSERRKCAVARASHERMLLILWVTLFGTSLFLLLMVLHAYHLTSPLGSPRTFAVGGPGWSGGGYSAVGSAAVPVFATPLQPPPSIDAAARAQRERELQMAEAEALDALVS